MSELKCGEACKGGEACSNSRIYISGLPKGVTADEVVEHFGNIGVVARERPKGRGVFPDMMPHRVKFYGNDDCLVQYEDSHAAHAAPSFFNESDFKGSTIKVELAEKKPNQGLEGEGRGGPPGGGGAYGGGGGAYGGRGGSYGGRGGGGHYGPRGGGDDRGGRGRGDGDRRRDDDRSRGRDDGPYRRDRYDDRASGRGDPRRDDRSRDRGRDDRDAPRRRSRSRDRGRR